MKKIAILGASRGLGWALYQQLLRDYEESEFLLVSRKVEQKRADLGSRTSLCTQDFSEAQLNSDFLIQLQNFNPTLLVYMAGGGPYGLFQNKKWSDHLWALRTSFLYPAELTHHILSHPEKWAQLQKIVLIGSSVAESQPDPLAASYSAAKHALKGLVGSINAEQQPIPKVLLFSPPYMTTDMLPVNSHPRLNDRAENPLVVAERLIEYIEKA